MSITRQATSPSWEFDVATSFCAAEVFFVMSKKPGARSFLATGASAEMLAKCSTPSGMIRKSERTPAFHLLLHLMVLCPLAENGDYWEVQKGTNGWK